MDKLITKYYESHRYYHTFTHITEMFNIAKYFDIELTKEQIYAILFHDVEYIPDDLQNEEKSVQFFRNYIFNKKATDIDVKIVEQIILDTKNHIPTTEQSKVVCDLDLFILRSSRLQYLDYIDNIEKEWIPNYCTEKQFVEGRINWIIKFLLRNKIYYSDKFIEHEDDARKNLSRELKHLQKREENFNE